MNIIPINNIGGGVIPLLNNRITNIENNISNLGNAIGMRGWNQLITGEFSNWTLGINVSYNNGIFNISGTTQDVGVLNLNALNDMNNHVIVLGYTHISGSFPNNIVFNDGYTGYLMENVGIGESTYILETMRSNSTFQISFNNVAVGTSVDFQIRPQMFDLTILFGAGNEPTTVEEFRKMFPADYYPYCSGNWADLLWTNPNPSTDFSAQPISISSISNYSKLLIIFREGYSGFNPESSILICGSNGTMNVSFLTNNRYYFGRRQIIRIQSGVQFTDATTWSLDEGIKTPNNYWVIPIYIYGIK